MRITKLITAVALAMLSLASAARADITTGLLLSLQLDNTNDVNNAALTDDSGVGSVQYLTNDPTPIWADGIVYHAGYTNTSLYFNTNAAQSTSNCIVIPWQPGIYDFNTTTQFTVAMWIYPESGTTANYNTTGCLFDEGPRGSQDITMEFYNSGQFRVYAVNKSGATLPTSSGIVSVAPYAAFANRQWYHIAMVWNGSDPAHTYITLYINGVVNGSVTNTTCTSIRTNGYPMRIGDRNSLNPPIDDMLDQPFKGRMDDIRVYNRALSAADILELFSPPCNGSVLPFNHANNGLGSGWTLKFGDDFTGTSLNKTNWVPYWFSDGTLLPGSSTRGYASNVTVNGQLNLVRISTNGACISSNPHGGAKPGFQFAYGYAEAQITLPTNGTVIAQWPAWWLDGQHWPMDGEIDIMEGLGGHAAWHYHYDSGGGLDSHPIGGNINTSPGTHIYGVNWYPGHLDFYYDGTKVASATNGSLSGGATISSSPMYLILIYAAGSGPLPATMVVHYVRVFQSIPVPTGLTAAAGNGQVALSWTPSTGATSYNVKSSTNNGGPYSVLASSTATNYTNVGLSNGTIYYYVVSAVNGGESANSSQVASRPVSSVPPQLGVSAGGGQIQMRWPADHFGWRLQTQTNLLGTNWLDVPQSQTSNVISIPIGITNDSAFFRLVYP